MIGVLFSHIFYSKIINYQTEGDWSPIVLPETGRFVTLAVTVLCQSFFEEFLRDNACVGKPVHPTFHADVDIPSFVHFFAKPVRLDNILWESVYFHL